MAKVEIEFEGSSDNVSRYLDLLTEIPWFSCVDSGYSAKVIKDDGEEVQVYDDGEQIEGW